MNQSIFKISLAVLIIAFATPLVSQEKATSEKQVAVNVNVEDNNGELLRTVNVKILEDGKEKILSWEDNGTIPEEVQSQLDAEGVEINIDEKQSNETKDNDEREVSVKVSADDIDGEIERTINIQIDEDGNDRVLEWTDDGDIPVEVKEQLDELGIDIQQLEGNGDGDYNQEIEVVVGQDKDSHEGAKIKIIEIELEDGEEIPDDIKELLNEHDINLEELIQNSKSSEGKSKQIKIRKEIKSSGDDKEGSKMIFIEEGEEIPEDVLMELKENGIDIDELKKNSKGKSKQIRIKKQAKSADDIKEGSKMIFIEEGEEIPEEIIKKLKENGVDIDELIKNSKGQSKKKKHIIKTKDESGKHKILQWDVKGEMPQEMTVIMKNEGVMELHESHDLENYSSNKAQLGVMIENQEGAVKILDVVENSAAAQIGLSEGDIITHIDGLQVYDIESLLISLKGKKPGDNVDITYVRDDQNFNATTQLKASKDGMTKEVEKIIIVEHCDTESLTRDENIDVLFKSISETDELDNKVRIIIKKQQENPETQEENKVKIAQTPIEPEEIPSNRKLKLDNYKTYPNPTSGVVNILFEAKSKPTVVQLADTAGRTIFKETLNDFNGRFEKDIDLSSNQPGQFILYVIQDQKIFTEVIVLQ